MESGRHFLLETPKESPDIESPINVTYDSRTLHNSVEHLTIAMFIYLYLDADGRKARSLMWQQITDELNSSYDTAFSVEQYKKKIQNVQ